MVSIQTKDCTSNRSARTRQATEKTILSRGLTQMNSLSHLSLIRAHLYSPAAMDSDEFSPSSLVRAEKKQPTHATEA
jgi:hypothetical protein